MIHLVQSECNGTEKALINCTRSTTTDKNCDHDRDAGVMCGN